VIADIPKRKMSGVTVSPDAHVAALGYSGARRGRYIRQNRHITMTASGAGGHQTGCESNNSTNNNHSTNQSRVGAFDVVHEVRARPRRGHGKMTLTSRVTRPSGICTSFPTRRTATANRIDGLVPSGRNEKRRPFIDAAFSRRPWTPAKLYAPSRYGRSCRKESVHRVGASGSLSAPDTA
jgi:hypothetical protein